MTPEERTLFERIRQDPDAARGAVADHVGWGAVASGRSAAW